VSALALAALERARVNLRAAMADVEEARTHLTGARQTRASELRDQVMDAVAFTQRLCFVVEGDCRAERAQ
jgi:hypothetical protein